MCNIIVNKQMLLTSCLLVTACNGSQGCTKVAYFLIYNSITFKTECHPDAINGVHYNADGERCVSSCFTEVNFSFLGSVTMQS